MPRERFGTSRWVHVLAAFALVVMAPIPSGSATGIPTVPGVLVDVKRTEPSVAVNPRNPLNLVAAANPNYDTNALRRYPPAYFSSFDGGKTWRGRDMPMPAPFWTGADTSVSFDGGGTAYIGIIGENSQTYCSQSLHSAAVLVARSLDGGRTVTRPVVVDVNPAEGDDDKPFIVVRDVPATPHGAPYTAVYVVWTRWLVAGGSRIMVSRSLDGGQTFTPARTLYRSPGSNMGAVPALGPHGELYVAWAHWTGAAQRTPVHLRIYVARSDDGGATFAPPARLALSWGLPLMLTPGLVRVFSMPAIAVDARSGSVYVAWPRARITTPISYAPVDADVVLSRSTDRGATWSAPVVLNDTARGDRFMPALALLPGGVVAAIFYDRRVDHSGYDVYLAAARDRGSRMERFVNQRLTRATSSIQKVYYIAPGSTCYSPGRWIGDYITLAADPLGASLSAIWADGQRGVPYQTDLRYARLSAGAALQGVPQSLLVGPAQP